MFKAAKWLRANKPKTSHTAIIITVLSDAWMILLLTYLIWLCKGWVNEWFQLMWAGNTNVGDDFPCRIIEYVIGGVAVGLITAVVKTWSVFSNSSQSNVNVHTDANVDSTDPATPTDNNADAN
jgi:hypothetical protein